MNEVAIHSVFPVGITKRHARHIVGAPLQPGNSPLTACDQNANVTRWTQPGSSEIQQSGVNLPVIARYQPGNPQYTQALHAATTLQRVGITQMKPLPCRELQENEGEDAREDWGEHGEDFDADWDRAQAYNDYLRDIEA